MPYNTPVHQIKVINTQLDSAVQAAVECLQRGELVIFPTETTYGLGADATNPAAVARLMQYKTQRGNKPLSILVTDQAMAEQYVSLNSTALQAYQAFLPGPVTVVSLGKHAVAPGVESLQGSLGVRISSHPIAQRLVSAFGKPITATSANASGKKRPYTLQDIWDHTSQRQQELIGLALDAGRLPPNPPSTVIDTTLDSLQVVRQGEALSTESEATTFQEESATLDWGEKLATRFRSHYGYQPVIFALTGPMGVGKTHLSKGIARGLAITERITSPTYTLLHEYEFVSEGQTIPLWHVDAWRMESAEELASLGLEKLFGANGVLILEWANLPQALLNRWPNLTVVSVELTYGENLTERTATLTLPSGQEQRA